MDMWDQVFRLLYGDRQPRLQQQFNAGPVDDELVVEPPMRPQGYLNDPERYPRVAFSAQAAAEPERVLNGPTGPQNPVLPGNPPNQGPSGGFMPMPEEELDYWDMAAVQERLMNFGRNLGRSTPAPHSFPIGPGAIGANQPEPASAAGPRVSEPIPDSWNAIGNQIAALDPTFQPSPGPAGSMPTPNLTPSPSPNVITSPSQAVPASAPPQTPAPQREASNVIVPPRMPQFPMPVPQRPAPAPMQVAQGGPAIRPQQPASNLITMPTRPAPTPAPMPTPGVVAPQPNPMIATPPVPFSAELAGVSPEMISQFAAQQPPISAPKPAAAPAPKPMRAGPEPKPNAISPNAAATIPSPAPKLGDAIPESLKEQILAEAMRITAANRQKPGNSPQVPLPQGLR